MERNTQGPIKRTEECVTIYDPTKAYNGYTLIAPQFGSDSYLIDMKGHVVNHWAFEHLVGGDGQLLPSGNLLRLSKTLKEPLLFFGAVSGQLIEVDWDGNSVWKYEDSLYMHHDFVRLENGNTVLNMHVLVPDGMVSKVKGGIPGTELKGGRMWSNAFREITPEGEVVWEWVGYEHYDLEIDVICPLCPRTIWDYCNGFSVLAEGDILASFRPFNTIAIIDKSTGAIKWRWGRRELGHQHNPTPLDNGNILVFDNGYHYVTSIEGSARNNSRVIEVNPKTGEIEWEYQDEDTNDFYSGICSRAQRLPNGNTLILEASKGRIFEVTADKQIVWEFFSPFYYPWDLLGLTNLIFKVHRYGNDYEGLKGKVLEPDRYEWVLTLREKGKPTIETPKKKEKDIEKAKRRLKHLGY